MIVEIMNEADIQKVGDIAVQSYLQQRFTDLEAPLDAKHEGYFLYIEDTEVFEKEQQLTFAVLPSIEQGLFSRFEDTMLRDGIVEMSLLINNEFMLSIIMLEANLSSTFCKRIV